MFHPRLKCWSKWAASALVLLLAMGYGLSPWWGVGWVSPGRRDVYIQTGVILVFSPRPASVPSLPRLYRFETPKFQWWFASGTRPPGRFWIVPIWAVLLPAFGGTAFLWVRDYRRPRKQGQCPSCGYEAGELLRGPHGKCPECGFSAITPPSGESLKPSV